MQAVVIGSVAKHENLLSLRVELVDARDDSHIWGGQYTRKPADIFTMTEKIAHEITCELHVNLTREQQQRLPQRQTNNAEAYHCYLKGRYYFNRLTPDGVQKASATGTASVGWAYSWRTSEISDYRDPS